MEDTANRRFNHQSHVGVGHLEDTTEKIVNLSQLATEKSRLVKESVMEHLELAIHQLKTK